MVFAFVHSIMRACVREFESCVRGCRRVAAGNACVKAGLRACVKESVNL